MHGLLFSDFRRVHPYPCVQVFQFLLFSLLTCKIGDNILFDCRSRGKTEWPLPHFTGVYMRVRGYQDSVTGPDFSIHQTLVLILDG